MPYKVFDIIFYAEDLEQLGTKEKFWFLFSPEDSIKWLFKFSRKNTGEHWSEKVAEQLSELLQIPHVEYDLARYNGRLGIISKNVINDFERMVMGNEVLHNHSPNEYPIPEQGTEKYVRVKEHTISRVLGCLDRSNILPPKTDFDIGDLNAGDVFCGYLMLDVLISNQDRHHENWAIIVDNNTGEHFLCPTYDHAASLGRELLDEERDERLNTSDKNRKVNQFVCKARSELFNLKTDKKPLLTIDVFYNAVSKRNKARTHWVSRLQKLKEEEIRNIFSNIPDNIITETAKEFAVQMILENMKRLLEDERA
jgi:hypothetical protein